MNNVTIGLYRHFKGQYYYVTGLSKSSTDEKTIMVNYFNVCHPEYGSFVRPLDDFIAEYDETEQFGDTMTLYIKDRKDNVTGQHRRMERVKDLNFQLGSVSTEQLIDELRKRTDSPIHELDIEGLRSKVFSTDYVVGIKHQATEEIPAGVETINVFFEQEEAERFYSNQVAKGRKGVFKRTFIEID